MRWLFLAICCCGIVCSVSSAPAEEGEPSLQVKIKRTTFNVGEKKAIYCEGNFLKDDMEWYSPSNEKILEKSTVSSRVYVERPSTPSASFLALVIYRTTLEDTGTYTCKSGDLNTTVDIFVGEKVQMKDLEENFVAEEGSSITFSCKAKGTPVPDIQWYNKDNELIVDSEKYKITYRNKSSTGYLKINNLTHLDPGTYVCKATQEKISHFAEKACHLTVHHKPVIMNEYSEREVYAILGEPKNITCKAIAFPLPNFIWSHHSNNNDVPLEGETENYKITTYNTSSELLLQINNETLDEQYKCTVENSKGRQNVIFHVSLGNKPNPPTAAKMVAATTSGITFEVSCESCIFYEDDGMAPKPENLPVLGYVFELVPHIEGFEHAYWVNATQQMFDITSLNQTSFTVDGLDKSTEYHVRVATRNLAGLSEWFNIEGYPTTAIAAALSKSLWLLICALIILFSY